MDGTRIPCVELAPDLERKRRWCCFMDMRIQHGITENVRADRAGQAKDLGGDGTQRGRAAGSLHYWMNNL